MRRIKGFSILGIPGKAEGDPPCVCGQLLNRCPHLFAGLEWLAGASKPRSRVLVVPLVKHNPIGLAGHYFLDEHHAVWRLNLRISQDLFQRHERTLTWRLPITDLGWRESSAPLCARDLKNTPRALPP